jgi:hypothetical protein
MTILEKKFNKIKLTGTPFDIISSKVNISGRMTHPSELVLNFGVVLKTVSAIVPSTRLLNQIN